MKEIIKFFSHNQELFLAAKITGVLLLSYIVYIITKKIVIRAIHSFTQNTKNEYDDVLLNSKFLKQLSLVAPLIIINYFDPLFKPFDKLVIRTTEALIAFVIVLAINTMLGSLTTLFEKSGKFIDKPIKGYIQVVKIVIYIFGTIIIIGILANQSPLTLLSAVGALTAVILLVFKDTLLSFVASVQISSYDLVRVGDWIEMPKFGADGDVVDIALHTIKVQNFDKTITVIPTYKLIEDSFKNWRGMQQSGGRRIKRSLYIDVNSVNFLDDADIEKFKKIKLLSGYMEEKLNEIEEHNRQFPGNSDADKRRLTNIGTFREYIKRYLSNRNDIHHEMTFLVRQLPAEPTGVPLEIYVFTNTTEWVKYEQIQSDIFDHLIAIVQEFNLRLYQNPTGYDFKNYVKEWRG